MDVKSDFYVFSKYKFNNIDVVIKLLYDDNRVWFIILIYLLLWMLSGFFIIDFIKILMKVWC